MLTFKIVQFREDSSSVGQVGVLSLQSPLTDHFVRGSPRCVLLFKEIPAPFLFNLVVSRSPRRKLF